jgi:hypothetical protein
MSKNNLIITTITILLMWTLPLIAGPPYDTVDPEPVELHHRKMYVASHSAHETEGWSSTAPHFEVNYGAAKNLQLHLIVPLAYNKPSDGNASYGFSDAEIGIKYRFVKEGKTMPQIGVFPLAELPTGNKDMGLGSGGTQIFLPIWIQKSFGKFTTYGGTGYWINPGEGNANWWYSGWQIQYNVNDKFNFGTELYHNTPKELGGESETRFNVGAVVNVTSHHHILFSVGRSIQGTVLFQGYAGYQVTL